jgi:hypothetical protein
VPDPLEDALGGTEPEPTAPDAGTAEPAAAFDPSQHAVVQSRFGGDVQKALDAYAELDRAYGQQGQQLGQQVQALEQQLAALQERSQEPEPFEGGQDGMPDMSLDQLREWFEENPADAAAFLIAQGHQMTMAQMKAELDERLKPVEVNVGRTTASSLVDGLKKAVGEEMVQRNAETLVQLQKTDPDFFKGDPQVIFQRMKTAVLAADYERNGGRRAAPAAATDVAVMGGSKGRNPQSAPEELSEAEEFVAAMLDPTGGQKDIVGNPIRTR